jgi:hypothetical protein
MTAMIDEQYFQRLLKETRDLSLSLPVLSSVQTKNDILESHCILYQNAIKEMKLKEEQLHQLENEKEATKVSKDQLKEAQKENQVAVEHEKKLEKEILQYIQTTYLDTIHLDKSSKEIIDAMLKCTIIQQATPKKLSEFCQQSEYNTEIIQELLDSSADIMKDMLINGGPEGGNYVSSVLSCLKKTQESTTQRRLTHSTRYTILGSCI